MITLRLYCRVADEGLGVIAAEQVPRVGDLLGYTPGAWSPYHKQHTWRVDAVVWETAQPGSPWALEQVRAGEGHRLGQDGTIADADVLVWPVPGPHWPETPSWAPPEPEGNSNG